MAYTLDEVSMIFEYSVETGTHSPVVLKWTCKVKATTGKCPVNSEVTSLPQVRFWSLRFPYQSR